jgi:initiation factor 1A
MVKNSTGGNKSKKQARKTTNISQQNKEIRKAKELGEIYAAVTKMFGGKECEVMCIDGKSRRCVMRSKFTFRGKAENNLSPGTMILVGVRDWEVRHNGIEKCDLLEVYSQSEKERLKQTEDCDFTAINNIITDPSNTKAEDVFSNYDDPLEVNDENDDNNDDDNDNNDDDNDDGKELYKKKEILNNKTDVKTQNDWIIDENDI